jgi:hypothetical protein
VTALLLGLVLAPSAHAAWWTREQAEAAAARTFVATDESQADRPTFRVALDDPLVRPRGRVRKDVDELYWQRFEVSGEARDLDSGSPVSVTFTLEAGGDVTEFHGPAPDLTQPSFPIRGAFYYPWFPENWTQAGTVYHPALGFYDSGDRAVAARELDALRYGNFALGIYSWWGSGSGTNTRLPMHLDVARQTPFRWAIYYEPEGYGSPTVPEIRSDLHALAPDFAKPAYLRVRGRPVVFVFEQSPDVCETAARWLQANDMGAYLVLDGAVNPVAAMQCAVQPDSWHLYSFSPAGSVVLPGYDVSIAPGFVKSDGPVLLARNVDRWRRNVQDMVASAAPWQLVISFSEWGEGTAVEPALEWSSPSGYGSYLDALHEVR